MEVIKENHSILGLKVLRRWTVRFITAGLGELLAETVSSDFKIFELVCTPEHVRSKQYRDKKGGEGYGALVHAHRLWKVSGREGWFTDPGGWRRVQWKALINPSVETWIGDCNYFWLLPLRFSPLYFYARMCTSKRRFNSCPNFPHSKFWKNCLCFNCFIYNMYENRYTSCSACAPFYNCRGFMKSINPVTSILFPLTVERLNHSLRWSRIKEMIINLRRFVRNTNSPHQYKKNCMENIDTDI